MHSEFSPASNESCTPLTLWQFHKDGDSHQTSLDHLKKVSYFADSRIFFLNIQISMP